MIDIMDIARKIYDIDPYSAGDYDETPESIAETIESAPDAVLSILNWVLDLYEEAIS